MPNDQGTNLSLKLAVDANCEIKELLRPWTSSEFYDFASQSFDPGHVYVVGRMQFNQHHALIRELVLHQHMRIVFSNPFEGSETLRNQIVRLNMQDMFVDAKMLLISGGDLEPNWAYLLYDLFATKIHDFEENLQAINQSECIYTKIHKPFKFLFLNGRTRPHRKYLLERFRLSGLLNQSLWSWLDRTTGFSRSIQMIHNGQDLLDQPHAIQHLPDDYEFEFYRGRGSAVGQEKFVKYALFNNEWGEIYINPRAYIDTYFSLVTETVFDYPYSFRTEKIWKPVAMAHPFVVAGNRGFYRDLHNMGFRTFGHLIDESFDLIENNQDRIQRVAQTVENLCEQDLASFLKECYTVCKYNQQHLAQLQDTTRKEFPKRFFQFIQQHFNE
jgi:hypothetical protein